MAKAQSQKRKNWKETDLEKSKPLLPLNEKQGIYIKSIYQNPTVVTLGPAGTGKTFIAASIASELFLRGQIDKIILTRPLVSVGKTAGLLPGTLDEKMEPWFRPITDVVRKKLGEGRYEIARKSRAIELAPFEQMQGRSFEDAFIILDEAQNASDFEMKMFLTRLGENTRTVIDGDIKQSSIKENSGLGLIRRMIERFNLPIPVVEFGIADIVRSNQCAMWIEAFTLFETNTVFLPEYEKRIGAERSESLGRLLY